LLVIVDVKTRRLYYLLWGWASGRKEFRDMRRFIIAKVGSGAYLYREDDLVRKVLLYTQRNYEKGKLRVYRVDDEEVDLTKPLTGQ
jgi:hypothetical protein